jgi:hypothetical protein
MGGLGNQMFQYAFGRALSLTYNTELFLDTTYLESKEHGNNFTYRNFELSIFGLSDLIATPKILLSIGAYPKTRWEFCRFRFLHSLGFLSRYIEPNLNFDFDYHKQTKRNTYLVGFWQSEKYFENYRNIIASDFIFKPLLSPENENLISEISYSQSVAIHIRRGDYLKSDFHNICEREFYEKAISKIYSKVENPVFYIFTEDTQWAKENINFVENLKIVEGNTGVKSYLDMQLMSNCKHQIIANSSFSWWAAWLNKNENKVVICPNKWFNDNSISTKDLIPKNWIRI